MNRFCLALTCALAVAPLACGPTSDDVSTPLAAEKAPQGRSRYPIVLHHGFLGFNRILFLDYFYEVRSTLEAQGYRVYATQVAPVNTIDFRTRQLKEQIDRILAETGAAKVNVIAHSMGGLDTRHLISAYDYGDKIASLTTIGTPHRGSIIADLAHGVASNDGARVWRALEKLFIGDGYDKAAHGPIDMNGALWNLTEEYVQGTFNHENPDDPRVVYQSYEPHSTWTGKDGCDDIDPLLALTFGYLRAASGDNDGLVSVESARYGTDLGTLPADHIDAIGQLFGQTSPYFDHRAFYSSVARNLAQRGF